MIRAFLLAVALTSCAAQPVIWQEPEAARTDTFVELPAHEAPPHPGICDQTVAWAREGDVLYAAWWNVRPDSTADLMVGRREKAGRWSAPERADTMDAGRTGCRRASPSIAVANGNVHVAYGMTAKEGPGVFTVHWMQGMAHSPVPVVYGERFGRTDIAVRGDTVAVAYEDPNTDPRRIGLAVSTTAAHLFQYRTLVSPSSGTASDPRVVLEPEGILVAWTRTLRGTQERQMRRGRFR